MMHFFSYRTVRSNDSFKGFGNESSVLCGFCCPAIAKPVFSAAILLF